jgi:mono/diheme cytochrome c family protein
VGAGRRKTMRAITPRYTPKSSLLLSLMVCAAVVSVRPALSQEQKPKVEVKKVPVQETGEIAGPKLYESYCAVCHGQDGKGNGPAAPALKAAPSDLTVLAKNAGGNFPTQRVMNVISNAEEFTAHGSKDMPMWGPIFSGEGMNPHRGVLRIHNLTDYLKSIQEK